MKSVDQYVDEVFDKCCLSDSLNRDAEVEVRDYIRKHLKQMLDRSSIVKPLFDEHLIAKLRLLPSSGRRILEKIHDELEALKISDILRDRDQRV